MSSNTRRIIIIAGAIVVALLILGMAWFFFFRAPAGGLQVGGDPFGNTGAGDVGSSETPTVLDNGVDFTGQAGTQITPKLVRITDAPVAYGVASLYIPEIPAATSTDGTVTPAVPPDVEIRFVERQSGNVYAYREYARTLARISNQTIPGVQESVWLANGSQVYLRYESDTDAPHIETYALPVNGGEGYILEEDLSHVAATSSAAVLQLRGSTTGSVVTVARPDGTGARTGLSSALSDFIVSFFGKNYLVATKASASVDGYAFLVSDTTGTWSRLAGPLRGLTAVASPTGTTALYSYVNRGALTLNVIDVASRTSTAVPVATFAEKCVYTKDGLAVYCAVPKSVFGTLPDDWYQGAVSFSDRIWKIDLTLRTALLLVDPSEVAETNIDAISLSLDPTNDFITFTNRNDGSLWSYDL